jgi:hypothetical protein
VLASQPKHRLSKGQSAIVVRDCQPTLSSAIALTPAIGAWVQLGVDSQAGINPHPITPTIAQQPPSAASVWSRLEEQAGCSVTPISM